MNTDAWRAWAEQLSTGLALVDADLRLQWINAALAELLGVGTRGVVGQPLAALLREPAAAAAAQRALAEQRTIQLRSALLSVADGSDTCADITLQPFGTGLLLEVHALVAESINASPLCRCPARCVALRTR